MASLREFFNPKAKGDPAVLRPEEADLEIEMAVFRSQVRGEAEKFLKTGDAVTCRLALSDAVLYHKYRKTAVQAEKSLLTTAWSLDHRQVRYGNEDLMSGLLTAMDRNAQFTPVRSRIEERSYDPRLPEYRNLASAAKQLVEGLITQLEQDSKQKKRKDKVVEQFRQVIFAEALEACLKTPEE